MAPVIPAPVRGLSIKDCDPERLIAPSSCILNDHDLTSPARSDEEIPIRNPSLSSSRKREVSIKDGMVQVSFKENKEQEEEVGDVSEDAHLCEAVLRSVLAVSIPVRSLEERLADVELVKCAFSIEDDSMLWTIMLRAQKAAQYRRAELQLLYDTIQRDELTYVNPEQFEDPQAYTTWKERELQELSTLITNIGTLPDFTGYVQIKVVSADNLKLPEVSCVCNRYKLRHLPLLHVYTSVTVLPSKSVLLEDKEPLPAFLTEVVSSVGKVEWHALSPWIPVNSVQDKVLIEVWEVQSFRNQRPKKKKSIFKRKNRKLKFSPWSGDQFIGQLILSFGQIESQALRQGVMRGNIPLTSYMLSDEKGRQKSITIQIQCACSCERLHRGFPSNKAFLRPPVLDIESAFDAVASVYVRTQKEGDCQLARQWERIMTGFASHYCLRNERCRLGIVANLAKLFQQDLHAAQKIVNEWLPVCESARQGKLTKNELALHTSIVSMLIKPAIDAIENFQAVFPQNKPPGALSFLLKLIGLVLRWDPDPEEILIPLIGWIKSSFEKRFYHYLFGEMSSMEQQPTIIPIQGLTNVIRLVRKDIEELETVFKPSFPETVHISAASIPTYYKLLSGYVVNAIRASQVKVLTKDCEDLVAELLSFHRDIELIGQQCDLLDLHSIFRDHVTQLITAAKTRMIDWVTSSVSTDKWEPISPQTGALFSFSVVDLYFMLSEVLEEMMTRLSALPFGEYYISDVEYAICNAVRTYVEILEKLCLRDLPEGASKKSVKLEVCISKVLCVKMNNMNAVLEQHEDLERRLQPNGPKPDERDAEATKLSLFKILEKHGSIKKGLSASFEELKQFTEQNMSNVIGSIVDNIQVRITRELQGILEADHSQFEPLTTYLDQHLTIMHDYLHPSIFQKIIEEICKTVFFCLEEYALNRDEDPRPMTPKQRKVIEESIAFLYDYFYGDGAGIDSKKMDIITARLRKILSCWDLNTRELCTLYWKAWDQLENSSYCDTEEYSDDLLHLLDYLWLLKQREDDEAREIVTQQNFIANKKMMQFMFGLPKEEELIASYGCRNFQKMHGTMYITSKNICFADTKMSITDSRSLIVISFNRMMRIEYSGKRSLIFIPFNQRPYEFSKFSDRDAICRTIFSQVAGTGLQLEKSMAPMWSDKTGSFPVDSNYNAIKVFKCRRQGLIHKFSGTLLVSTAYILFSQDDKQKIIQMDHSSISRIHAERRGLRPSGVIVELKSGEDFEFCEFQCENFSNKEIARELHKLVFPGAK